MKKIFLWAFLVFAILYIFSFYWQNKGACPLIGNSLLKETAGVKKGEESNSINSALLLLKTRKDKEADAIFTEVLIESPENLDALWGKAEVLRRSRDFKDSESIFKKILSKNPTHYPSLISLAYIRYKDNGLLDALKLVNQVLHGRCLDKETRALAHMMLGAINSRRSASGCFLNKVRYGTQIKCFFLRAKELAPDLPEVHLSLGTFYLLAPAIVGGNLKKAVEELGLAVKLAPDFATANARLAQAYQRKGNPEKYSYYLKRAQELDPQNEVFQELE